MDADAVRELVERGEVTRVEMKATLPEQSKLIKGLCGMANALARGSEPAHLIVGYKEDKEHKKFELVGVDPASIKDEATYRQQVASVLNRVPPFSIKHVDVDGLHVAVFEVRSGRRPYYPTRDSAPLRKYVAVYRDGAAVVEAAPELVVEWTKEDGPGTLQEAELEARRKIIARGSTQNTLFPNRKDEVWVYINIENGGKEAFSLVRAEATFRYLDALRTLDPGLPRDVQEATVTLNSFDATPPSTIGKLSARASFRVDLPSGSHARWGEVERRGQERLVEVRVTAALENLYGGSQIISFDGVVS